MPDKSSKLALVTGASRGVGAEVARQLAHRGADVVVNYRSKEPRAQTVADQVRALGRDAHLARADLTDSAAVAAMMELVARIGPLDVLVLNASGGLEKNVAPDYAMRLNLDAQVGLLQSALPLLAPGARVVFVTSHLAHFYGEKAVPPLYEPVAASKRAGEDALRARAPDLDARGARLVVVSGDMIEGTITPKLMERASRGAIEARRAQAGTLPTVEEFARAIVDAAFDADLPGGATIYVGQID